MRSLFAIVFFLVTLSLGTSLKCYFCVGSKRSDCAQSKSSSMVQQECPGRHNMSIIHPKIDLESNDIEMDIKQYCAQFTVPINGSIAFMRGCIVLPSTIEPCEFVKEKLHGKFCKSCTTSLCNK